MNRLIALQQFLEEDPNDPFNYYALALELRSADPLKSKALLSDLMLRFPQYLPTYYPLAHLLIELGEREAAEKTFEEGKGWALSQNDQKTLRELTSAYNDWLFERD